MSREASATPAGPLSTDLRDPAAVPYFLWNEPMTVADLHRRLETASHAERTRLLAKILREAKDTEAWAFTSPKEVPGAGPSSPPASAAAGPSGSSC